MKIVHIYSDPNNTNNVLRLLERDGVWRICKRTKQGWRKVAGTKEYDHEFKARHGIVQYAFQLGYIHDEIPEKFLE